MIINGAYVLGRILIPLVFIVEGIRTAFNVSGFARTLANTNIPIPDEITPYLGSISKYEALGYLIAAIVIICGLMILVGLKARWAALILAVVTACTIIFAHNFWDMSGEQFWSTLTEALRDLSILGGLLLVVAAGSGPSSMDTSR